MVCVLVVVFWLLDKYIFPRLPEPAKTVVIVVVVFLAIVILLGLIGIGPGIRL